MSAPIAIDPAFLRMQDDSLHRLDDHIFSDTGGARRAATHHPAPGGTNPLAEPTPASARRRDTSSRGGGRELHDPKGQRTP